MELTLNNEIILTTDTEGFKKIDINDKGVKPVIAVEYNESNHYSQESFFSTSKITYEKDTNNGSTRISYSKSLTAKSGLEINFTINQDNIIEKGYADFYTIKNSTTKRNGSYRLEFDNSLFKLYAITSRKNGYKKTLSHYIVKDGITPEKLSTIIFRMIRIVESYAKKTNKNSTIESIDNFSLIESLIFLEDSVKDRIQDILLYGALSTEEQKDLKDFLSRYQGFKNQAL